MRAGGKSRWGLVELDFGEMVDFVYFLGLADGWKNVPKGPSRQLIKQQATTNDKVSPEQPV